MLLVSSKCIFLCIKIVKMGRRDFVSVSAICMTIWMFFSSSMNLQDLFSTTPATFIFVTCSFSFLSPTGKQPHLLDMMPEKGGQ